jgi:hypothetical protein
VLGASSYTSADATRTQQVHDWIASHQRTFALFRGAPEVVVCDRGKVAGCAEGLRQATAACVTRETCGAEYLKLFAGTEPILPLADVPDQTAVDRDLAIDETFVSPPLLVLRPRCGKRREPPFGDLACRADPAPPANQNPLAHEQGRMHRQPVEPGHVLPRIAMLKVNGVSVILDS